MHEGHRKRMAERLAAEGEHLQEHELLEILLYSAIPRKNTNPLAHRLLSAFGSLDGVFNASFEQLLGVEGVGESTAAFLRCVALCYQRVRIVREAPPSAYNVRNFSQYVSERFRGLSEENIDLYCLDGNGTVRFTKRLTTLERSRVQVPIEEIGRMLVSHRPRGLVIAHNHPVCGSQPSEQDDKFTAQIEMICSVHGVMLYDHIIVGQDGYYSYCLAGRMEDIRRDFNVANIIGRTKVV